MKFNNYKENVNKSNWIIQEDEAYTHLNEYFNSTPVWKKTSCDKIY